MRSHLEPNFGNISEFVFLFSHKASIICCTEYKGSHGINRFFFFQSGLQLKVRLEDIRLLESRKSSRLMSQSSTDFSKLADFNIVHERKRLNSEKSSDGSEFLG